MAQKVKLYLDEDPQLAVLPFIGGELVTPAPGHYERPREDSPALLPTRELRPGEQYRFHFDMTKCIGCKCCVVACNEQNGNPAAINWRRVGEVEGGHYPHARRYHLSMGCNHCLEPSCLQGCPVEAYSKDPYTGVVIHSAEACIGCQYCTWNCSYGVPQFNADRGVVGKCDLCHNRIAENLAPACVAACPENAIGIEIVNVAEWRMDHSMGNAPGLPPAQDSISTTRITLPDDLPPDTGRVDTQRLVPEQPHWPLVVMLVLTQLSAGAFITSWILSFLSRAPGWGPRFGSVAVAGLSLGIATLHLGRPVHAWRALRGLRRSWLSREILALSLFAGSAGGYAIFPQGAIGLATLTCGVCGIFCSARIYMVPARPAWNSGYTVEEFFATALLLGPMFVWVFHPDQSWLARAASLGACAQLLTAARKFLWLSRAEQFELRGSALLLSGRLRNVFLARLALLIASGIALPVSVHSSAGAIAAFLVAAAGEFAGRWLFFVSVTPKSIASQFLVEEKAA